MIKVIALLDVVGLMALDFARSIPKAAHAAFLMVLLVLVAQPAQAAQTFVPTAVGDDPGSFIGCPSLAWAAPLQGTSQNITGMVLGFIVIEVLLVMLVSGVRLVFANNRSDRAAGAIEGVKHAGMGAAVVLIGLPVVAGIIWGLSMAFSPACQA